MTLARLWLHLQLVLVRAGGMRVASIAAALAALLVWSVFLPRVKQQAFREQQMFRQAQFDAKAVAPAPKVQRVVPDRAGEFYNLLGDRHHAEHQIKTIFALAQRNAVALNSADYRIDFDADSQIDQLKVKAPIKGTYGALRNFIEDVLLAIPFAALEELHVKREVISSPIVEAQLAFTLYLHHPFTLRAEHAD